MGNGQSGGRPAWSLAVHGGAGDLGRDEIDGAREDTLRRALSAALAAGVHILSAGGPSLDAVEAAVVCLEDAPFFNAGKGSVLNSHGEHELDASIMDGHTRRAGAVAVLKHVRNPVALARRVMERSPHVFLQGPGAEEFARTQGLDLVEPGYFSTEARRLAFDRLRGRPGPAEPQTVGAVALDVHGHLSAATSTGGLTNKLPGRVSDSAVIGAGTYAADGSCAVSCTGQGEYFIRATAARDVAALLEYGGRTLRAAAEIVLRERVGKLGGRGGLIAVDARGGIVCPFNTDTMYRAFAAAEAPPVVAIYRHEPDGTD